MCYTVYVLVSERDHRRYIGCTRDLSRRLEEHNRGLVKSTRHRRPLRLVYREEFETKTEALGRERFFKTGQGRCWLKEVAGV